MVHQYDTLKIENLIRLAQRDNMNVCVWGAGIIGKGFGKKILDELSIKIDYYCDNNENLIEKEIIDGIFCRDRSVLLKNTEHTVCVILLSYDNILYVKKQLVAMGIKNIITLNDLLSLDYIVKKHLPFMNNNTVIYTCITGEYDDVSEPVNISDRCDYYLISEKAPENTSIYKWINVFEVIPVGLTDPISMNRYCKMNAHKIFPNYRYSIYHDGNIKIQTDFSKMISKLRSARIGVSAHNPHDSLYVEAVRCMGTGKTDLPEVYMRQVESYWNQGMPFHYASYLCNVLIREHNHPSCIKIMEDWWKEFSTQSRRDQVSFPFALWKNGFKPEDVFVICDDDIDPFHDSPYWNFDSKHNKSRIHLL